jgi:hypothetical protein
VVIHHLLKLIPHEVGLRTRKVLCSNIHLLQYFLESAPGILILRAEQAWT